MAVVTLALNIIESMLVEFKEKQTFCVSFGHYCITSHAHTYYLAYCVYTSVFCLGLPSSFLGIHLCFSLHVTLLDFL